MSCFVLFALIENAEKKRKEKPNIGALTIDVNTKPLVLPCSRVPLVHDRVDNLSCGW